MDNSSVSERLFDELDTSLDFGSGVICLSGPPGSGKTTLLLDYLAAREDNFSSTFAHRNAGSASVPAPRRSSPVLHTEYMTALSISTGVWTYLAHRLLHHLRTQQERQCRAQGRRPEEAAAAAAAPSSTRQRLDKRGQGRRRRHRRAGEYSALEFAHLVLQWLEAQAVGSELHLVVDDVDTLDGGDGGAAGSGGTQPQQLDLWLSGDCLSAASDNGIATPGGGRRVYMWVIAQLPLQLRHCFRYHTLAPPSTAVMLSWLDGQYAEHAGNEADVHACGRKRDRQHVEDCCCVSAAAYAEPQHGSVDRTSVHIIGHNPHSEVEEAKEARLDTWEGGTEVSSSLSEGDEVGLRDSRPRFRQRCVSSRQAHAWVRQGLEYYTTHQPMSTSLASRDIRQLLRRIDTVLPALIMTRGVHSRGGGVGALDMVEALCDQGSSSTSAVVEPVNAIQLAAAWGMYTELRNAQDGYVGSGGAAAMSDDAASASLSVFARIAAAAPGGAPAGGRRHVDPLVQALKQLGYSAVLLAFVAFYCGAVPANKQYQALAPHHHPHRRANRRSRHTTGVHETSAQSHRATVLSASAHVITLTQLLFVYRAVREVCAATVDTRELVSAEVAMHYVGTLVSWGLLTPVLTQQARSYHCWIAVSTAQLLGHTLGINIFDIIPN